MAWILNSVEKTIGFVRHGGENMFRPGSSGAVICTPLPAEHVGAVKAHFGSEITFGDRTVHDVVAEINRGSMVDVGRMMAALECMATPDALQGFLTDAATFLKKHARVEVMGQSAMIDLDALAERLKIAREPSAFRTCRIFYVESGGQTTLVMTDAAGGTAAPSEADMERFLALATERATCHFDLGRSCDLPADLSFEALFAHPLFTQALGLHPTGYAITIARKREGDGYQAFI